MFQYDITSGDIVLIGVYGEYVEYEPQTEAT